MNETKRKFEKVIDGIILKKYPWINSFMIQDYHTVSGADYHVYVYTDDESMKSILGDNDIPKLEEDIMTLFKMIGPNLHQRYIGLTVRKGRDNFTRLGGIN